MKRLFLISFLIALTSVNCAGQISNFIGLGYSRFSIRPAYSYVGTNSTTFNEHYAAYLINYTCFIKNYRIGFNGSVGYSPIQYTNENVLDSRYPYNYQASEVWMGTEENVHSQNLDVSIRLMFSTKDKFIRGFFAIGPVYEVSLQSMEKITDTYE